MSRKVFDVLTSTGGLIGVVVLLVAGGLLTWGHSFVNSNVRDQLARQEISFPPQAAFAHAKAGTEITPAMIPSVSQYAGQQLLTGQQAEAYADHFIAIHLSEMPYGGIYSKISGAAIASPTNTKLATLKTTSFQGTTLRGLLLEAYAFSKIGMVMLWGAIASFVLAAMMLLLVGLGFQHARSTAPEKRMLAPKASPAAPAV
jgi:hypothetical protein